MNFIKLYESYRSQKELEYLAKLIVDRIAEKTFERLDSNLDIIDGFVGVRLNEFNMNHFDEIKDFILASIGLEIIILTSAEMDGYKIKGEGAYIKTENKKYIFLRLKEYTIKRFSEYITKWDYNNDEKILSSISYVMNDSYRSTVIHELQHAYDDYRSNGKAITQGDEVEQLGDSPTNAVGLKEDEREMLGKLYIKYLNLKHEVDARFAQAIEKTVFYLWDIDKSTELNKDVYTIIPFKDVFRAFKINMGGYKFLSDIDKKRVQRKLGQFYQYEKEFIINKNKESKTYEAVTNEALSTNKFLTVEYVAKKILAKLNKLGIKTNNYTNWDSSFSFKYDIMPDKISKVLKSFKKPLIEKDNMVMSFEILEDNSKVNVYFKDLKSFRIIPPKIVYHQTKAKNIESIKKQGLNINSSENWDDPFLEYPPSIFVTINKDNLFFRDPDYVVLEIDTTVLKNKWYKDLNLYYFDKNPHNLMTFESIPSSAIKF